MTAGQLQTSGGISFLRRDGEGMPVVLLHGIGSNAESFTPLMAAFAAGRPVIAWNAPGYNASMPLTAEWPDATDYASALAGLLDRLDRPRCILIGHSLGVLMAARFAVNWPERVALLALISPALGYGGTRGDALPPPVAARIADLDRLGPQGFAALRAPGLVGDPAARPDIVESVQQAMSQVKRPGYDHASRMLATARLLDDAALLKVPTTVMVGSIDRVTPPKNAHQLFEALGLARRRHLVEIPGAGHAVCQEQPDAVVRALSPMIDEASDLEKVEADA